MTIGNLIKRYGWTEESVKKLIHSRMKNVPIGRASRTSLRFFIPLYKKLRKACIGRKDIRWGIGNSSELWLRNKEKDRLFFYDFSIESLKVIIEFNGSKFHAKTEKDKLLYRSAKVQMETDALKKRTAEKFGYSVLVVWDYEANTSKMEEMFKYIRNRMKYETM